MALPLIYAAGAIVARYIAKRGLQAAAKKYTKKAISEGKKHAKDMVTKPTKGQADTKAGVRGMRNARQLGRQAAGIGVGVGAAGAGAVGAAKLKKQKKITAATSAKDKREANEKLGNQAKALQQKLAKERAAKRKANTAAERAKSQTSIEKLLGQVMVADTKAKLLNEKLKKAPRPKLRPKK